MQQSEEGGRFVEKDPDPAGSWWFCGSFHPKKPPKNAGLTRFLEKSPGEETWTTVSCGKSSVPGLELFGWTIHRKDAPVWLFSHGMVVFNILLVYPVVYWFMLQQKAVRMNGNDFLLEVVLPISMSVYPKLVNDVISVYTIQFLLRAIGIYWDGLTFIPFIWVCPESHPPQNSPKVSNLLGHVTAIHI